LPQAAPVIWHWLFAHVSFAQSTSLAHAPPLREHWLSKHSSEAQSASVVQKALVALHTSDAPFTAP
jgi:hypothetical protein